jgi:hypothetical protein
LVELCVYFSTVNKSEISIQLAQRNADDVNEYLLKAQLSLPSDRRMMKSILILDFSQPHTPTNAAPKTW